MSMKYTIYIGFITLLWLLNGSNGVSAESPCISEVVSAVAPIYPRVAYMARMYGTIKVLVEVNNSGAVINAKAIKKNLLSESSEKAALKWEFKTINDSELIVRKYEITFKYRLMPEYTQDEDLTCIYNPPYEIEVRIRNEAATPITTHEGSWKETDQIKHNNKYEYR